MRNKFSRWLSTLNYPSYVIFFVTAKCNAACKMCFYKEKMSEEGKPPELSPAEYEKIARHIKLINILGISGGEPFLREDLSEIVKILYRNCSPLLVDLPTNGFFIGSVLKQVEDIAKHCKNMVVDLQLSIDGPEEIHNEIRGLKDGFNRIQQTYRGLVELKDKYRNLRVKACIVYSHYNEGHVEELFDIIYRDFKGLDRIVFSVVHGSVGNAEAFKFDWEKYFAICERIRRGVIVKSIKDFHSLFTVALRIAKNDFLKEILKTKDMYRKCRAGKRVIVVNEIGKVFPCEPLWHPVGDLRRNGYDIGQVLRSQEMKIFQRNIIKERCTCHWGLPLSNTLIYEPRYYPLILSEAIKIIIRSMTVRQKASLCQ